MTKPQLFATMSFADVDASIGFLTAVGFVEQAVYRDETDPSIVQHAQFAWRDTGGLMFGSAHRPERPFSEGVGQGKCYCVVAHDADVDRVHAAALAAGATSVQEPADQDYGGRSSSVRDREGNLWSFGSYPGV